MNVTQWDPRARVRVAADIRKGDSLYDAHGGTHVVRRVRATRRGVVKILREDSVRVMTIPLDQSVTVIPGRML